MLNQSACGASDSQDDEVSPRAEPQALMQRRLSDGISLYTRGNVAEAFQLFLEALDAEPYAPSAHYLCGLALGALGLEGEAQYEWRLVLALVPQTGVLADAGEAGVGGPEWAGGMARRLLGQNAQD